MSTPANALQAGIYNRLAGYAALTSLATGGIYDFVPETVPPPFVVIGDDTAIDWSTKTTNGWETTITIHCWAFEVAGRKNVKAIMSAIYDALHRQESNITVSGFNLVMLQSEFETSVQDPSAQGQGDRFYHGIQRFRALIHA
jgi:hypothetical protein